MKGMRIEVPTHTYEATSVLIKDIGIWGRLLDVLVEIVDVGVYPRYLRIQLGRWHRITIDSQGVVRFSRQTGEGKWAELQIQGEALVYHPERPHKSTGRRALAIPTGVANHSEEVTNGADATTGTDNDSKGS